MNYLENDCKRTVPLQSFSGFIPLIVPRKGFSPHISPPDFLFIFIPPNHPTPDIHKLFQMKEPWVFGRDFGVLIVWGIVIFCNFVGW